MCEHHSRRALWTMAAPVPTYIGVYQCFLAVRTAKIKIKCGKSNLLFDHFLLLEILTILRYVKFSKSAFWVKIWEISAKNAVHRPTPK